MKTIFYQYNDFFKININNQIELKEIFPIEVIRKISSSNLQLKRLVVKKHIDFYLEKRDFDKIVSLLKILPDDPTTNKYAINTALDATYANNYKGADKILESIDDIWAAFGYLKISKILREKGNLINSMNASQKSLVKSNGEVSDSFLEFQKASKEIVTRLLAQNRFSEAKKLIENIGKIRISSESFNNTTFVKLSNEYAILNKVALKNHNLSLTKKYNEVEKILGIDIKFKLLCYSKANLNSKILDTFNKLDKDTKFKVESTLNELKSSFSYRHSEKATDLLNILNSKNIEKKHSTELCLQR